ELPIGPVEPGCQLRCELEYQARALCGDLPEARISHFRQLALVTGPYPGAAGGLLVEQPHLTEELTAVEVGEHHLVAFLVLDHDFNRAADDVVKDIRQVARMDHHRLRRYGPDPAVTQESVDSRDIAQRLDVLFHHGSPNVGCVRRPAFLYICL